MSRANGSRRRRALESFTSRPLAGSRASAPFASSSFRNCWVSASSEARTSSGFTCGCVEASGTVESSLTSGARLRARIDLDHHVVQAGLRPQQQRGVVVDQRRVLVVDLHADHGVAVLELHAGDLADLDPGDVDRLALAGRDGLRGGEVGLELEAVGPDQRHPARQVRPLVDQDHRDREEAGQDQADDGQDVAEVCSQRSSHGYGAGSGGPWSRRRAVQVGDRVALAGDVGPEGRLGAGDGAGCRSAGSWAAPERLLRRTDRPERRAQVRDGAAGRDRAAGREEAQRGPVAVEWLRSPASPVVRVAELLVVRHAGREVVAGAGVAEDDVAGREQDVVHAAAEQADLGEERPARRPPPCRRLGPPRAAGSRCSRARSCRAARRSGRARAATRRSWPAAP